MIRADYRVFLGCVCGGLLAAMVVRLAGLWVGRLEMRIYQALSLTMLSMVRP